MTARLQWPPAQTGAPFVGFADAAAAAVNHLNRQLPGMGLWLVTCVVGDRQLVVASAGGWADRTPAGTEFPWQASLCLRMVRGQAPPVAPNIASEPGYRQVAIGPLAKVRAYLGVPLLIGDGELFGTLCALAGAPQPATWHEVMPVVSLLGRMLSTVLSGERAARDRSVEAAHAYALAARDPLTELCNRRGFEQALRTEQGRGQRFGTRSSVVVITIDPPGGADAIHDDALRRCAEVLAAVSLPGDVAARLGGAEFALLAAETDLIGVRALQIRLRRAFRAADLLASVGAATRRLGDDLAATWATAERAMRVDARRRTRRPWCPEVRAVR